MMIQPIAQSVPAFDAKNDNIFKFVSEGGNQVVSNRLVVRNNNTGQIVYNKKIETYRFEHLLPKNTLTNGVYYNFYFQTYDINDNESPKSNVIAFMCYDTPTLEIVNIPLTGRVENSTFTLEIKYDQKQKELLDITKVILFNTLGNKIFESGSIYATEEPPFNFKYVLKGLDYNTTYEVQVIGITINKTAIQSPKYIFTTRYATPQLNSLLELTNKCDEGCVELKNNFIVVNSEQNPPDLGTNPKYLHDGKLELIEQGTYLTYKDGFNIKDDFTSKLFIENPNLGNIVTLIGYGDKIEVNLIQDEDYYFELKATSGTTEPYIIYSNPIKNKSKLMVWIRQKNHLYEIKGEELL